MSQKLAKSADSVQQVLTALRMESQVLELPTSTRTASEAASSIGCTISQIVKSLVFKTISTNKPVLILVSGSNQVNESHIETYVGEGLTKAEAKFVKEITGFAIGGIPPIGHKNRIDLIYIDQDLMKLDQVWAAAGTPHAVFCLKSKDLLKATQGKFIPVSP